MDLVSAYKAVGGVQGGGAAGGLKPGGEGAGVGRLIPAGELEKLSSGVFKPEFATVDGGMNVSKYSPLSMGSAGPTNGRSFDGMLSQMVTDVSAKQATAGNAVMGVLSGNGVPLHQAMLSVEEASVSFQMMVEVRNRMLDAYQELMRMQI